MNILTDFVGTVLGPLVHNSGLQLATVGLITKFAIDEAKKLAAQVDASGLEKKYAVPLHYIVAAASAVVAVANLALQGQLSTADFAGVATMVNAWVSTVMAATAAHTLSKHAMLKFLGRATLKAPKG